MVGPSATTAPTWVALGVFTQPHGVSGRLKVKSFCEPPESFASHTNLTDEAGNPVKLRLTGSAQGQFIVAVEGLTRREHAELWRGKKIGVPRAALAPVEHANQFYAGDLAGMPVVTSDGAPFGTVRSIENYGAGDIVVIERIDGSEALYAFTHATFPEVDLPARRMVIDPPELLGSKAEEEGAA